MKTKIPDNYQVALLTITQYSRKDWLSLLFDCVKKQTGLKFVNRWVIVDGSKNNDDQPLLESYLSELNKNYNFNIQYHSTVEKENRTIAWLRNYGNDLIDDSITHIIVMDDDDYQFPTRVEKTLELFYKKKCNLVGTNSQYLYHSNSDKMMKFKDGAFGDNHSVNSCLAYTYDYKQNNRYDDSKAYAEEPSFLNDFKNPMEQLNYNDSIIGFSYNAGNTYNKNLIILQNILLSEHDPDAKCCTARVMEKTLSQYLGNTLANKYLELMDRYEPAKQSEYDITYYTGFMTIQWEYNSRNLGGSESAVMQLCRNWVKQGLKVEVYGMIPSLEFKNFVDFEGIHIKHSNKFSFKTEYNNLILWRQTGLVVLENEFNIKAKKVLVDLHDHCVVQYRSLTLFDNKIDKIFYKSPFHLQAAVMEYQFKPNFDKSLFIQNGIELDVFTHKYNVIRDKYRFCYASSYFRGLKDILLYCWPLIVDKFPQATFHIYYGMEHAPSDQERDEIQVLINKGVNVFDYGRVGKEIIAAEKQTSMWHLYPTRTPSEICCISITESLACGCVPVISNVNLFSSLPGLMIEWEQNEPENIFYTRVANRVIDCILNAPDDYLENCSNELMKHPKVQDWSSISKIWTEHFWSLDK